MAAAKHLDRARVLALIAKGWSHRRIARELGATHQAVTYLARAARPRCPQCHAPLSRATINAAARAGGVDVAV